MGPSVTRGGLNRGKRSEPGATAPLNTASAFSGSSPGKIAASASPSKRSSPTTSPASASRPPPSRSPSSRTVVSRVARTDARATVHPGACGLGAAHGAVDEDPQEMVEPVVIRGWCGRPSSPRTARGPRGARAGGVRIVLRPVRKAISTRSRASSSSARAVGPASTAASTSTSTICRSMRWKWSRKNGRGDMSLIGLEPPLHQRRERVGLDRLPGREIERREGERRRAFEIARHEEPPRRVVATASGPARRAARYSLKERLASWAFTSSAAPPDRVA